MNAPKAEKLSVFQSVDHPEDPFLLRPFQPRLKSDHVIGCHVFILCPELYDCMRFSSCMGSGRPTGFIGPNLMVSNPLEAMTSIGMHPSKTIFSSNPLGLTFSALNDRLIKLFVLLLAHRTIEVISPSLSIAGGPVYLLVINRFGINNRRYRVIKIEIITADALWKGLLSCSLM